MTESFVCRTERANPSTRKFSIASRLFISKFKNNFLLYDVYSIIWLQPLYLERQE